MTDFTQWSILWLLLYTSTKIWSIKKKTIWTNCAMREKGLNCFSSQFWPDILSINWNPSWSVLRYWQSYSQLDHFYLNKTQVTFSHGSWHCWCVNQSLSWNLKGKVRGSNPTPLIGWFHWLVQDSRQRRTIWTFTLLTALFVLMPAHYLYVEIFDLIQIYLICTLKRG